MASAERRRFLCCEAELSTRILAWINILLHLIALITIIAYGPGNERLLSHGNNNIEVVESLEENHFTGLTHNVLEPIAHHKSEVKGHKLADFGWEIFWRMIHLTMTGVLLVGSYKKIPVLLKSFIVFEAISTIMCICSMVLRLSWLEKSVETTQLVGFLVGITLSILIILSAYCHHSEVEEELEKSKSFVTAEP